ncbi:hypothetical protein HNO53_13085 [Billgrantia antri]|uniref:DUF5405 domain-containing protein n=1 Tax=Halomonas sulfidivorans TaxID=2733488 RepID=A0ABX7WHG1_9GAMM|nr:hypothetical protein [Halomonas sulfidivorans]QTP59570.1 hypothetical protein HNO53_13085 [Halomonas sulfidivorans]
MSYEVKYHLHGNGHNHNVVIKTDPRQFRGDIRVKFKVEIIITDLTRMENAKFEFTTTHRFSTRTLAEIVTKDLRMIKRYMVLQEEIRELEAYHNYSHAAIMGCIKSFLAHLDNVIEADVGQKLAGNTK